MTNSLHCTWYCYILPCRFSWNIGTFFILKKMLCHAVFCCSCCAWQLWLVLPSTWNFYFASAAYNDEAGDKITSQEQLILLKLLNNSLSTYYVLTSFTQQPTCRCNRGVDTNKIPRQQLQIYSKLNHTKPPRVCFPAATVRRREWGRSVLVHLTGQLCMLNCSCESKFDLFSLKI